MNLICALSGINVDSTVMHHARISISRPYDAMRKNFANIRNKYVETTNGGRGDPRDNRRIIGGAARTEVMIILLFAIENSAILRDNSRRSRIRRSAGPMYPIE